MNTTKKIINLNEILRPKTDEEIQARLADMQTRRPAGAPRIAALRRNSPEQFNVAVPGLPKDALKKRLLDAIKKVPPRTTVAPGGLEAAPAKPRTKRAKPFDVRG